VWEKSTSHTYPEFLSLGEEMKVTRIAKVAIATAAAAGLAAGTLSPASAATRSTVVLVTSNQMTSLNSGTPDTNLTVNSEIGYLQGFGFNYYDNAPKLVRNNIFGSYKIVSQNPFKVQYTVNKGKVWSDGTPITGVDLLLSHVLASSSYSFAAKLGDPTDPQVRPAFNALGYGGIYDQTHVGLPTLSADKMSVTIEYDSKIPDWEITGPGPSAVHALIHLAEGKTSLQSAAANLAAKAKFEKAFYLVMELRPLRRFAIKKLISMMVSQQQMRLRFSRRFQLPRSLVTQVRFMSTLIFVSELHKVFQSLIPVHSLEIARKQEIFALHS